MRISKHLKSLLQDKDGHLDKARSLLIAGKNKAAKREYAIVAQREEEIASQKYEEVVENLMAGSLLSAGCCWSMAGEYQKALTCLVKCLNSNPTPTIKLRAIEAIRDTSSEWALALKY